MAPRTPLLHPGQYFEQRRPSVGRALALVVLLTVGTVAGVYALGWVMADRIDGTVTVDNPDRPHDAFCDGTFGDDETPAGCDEPETVERNVDRPLNRAIGRIAGQFVVAMPLLWVLVGLALHAGSWLAGGEGSAANSFVVAAWGLLPALAAIAVGVVVLALTFDPVTVTDATVASGFEDRLLAELDVLRTVGAVISLATTVWSAVVWRFGLVYTRNVSGTAASAIAGGVALVLLLLGA